MPTTHQHAFDNLNRLKIRDLRQPGRLREVVLLKINALRSGQLHDDECERHARRFVALVEDVLGRRYDDITLRCFTHVCAALEYLLEPNDERADTGQRGLEDDAKELRDTAQKFKQELDAYTAWQERTSAAAH